jgi:hypothetical protein
MTYLVDYLDGFRPRLTAVPESVWRVLKAMADRYPCDIILSDGRTRQEEEPLERLVLLRKGCPGEIVVELMRGRTETCNPAGLHGNVQGGDGGERRA